MPVSTHRKSQIVGITDALTAYALKIGGSAFAVALIFSAIVIYGGHIHGLDKMSPNDKGYLLSSVQVATQALVIGAVVVVAALIVRCSRFEETGQILSLVGAGMFFGIPLLLGATANVVSAESKKSLLSIVNSLRTAGTIGLLPGLVLVLRDGILRIWNGVSVRRVMARRWQDAERKIKRRGRLLPKCWEMDTCRSFVRDHCPAWLSRKSCWKIKTGCCDESVILKALAAGGMDKDNIHAQGIIASLGAEKPNNTKLSRKLRGQRCKRCFIYARHQADKYRVLSPLVFPAVLLVMWAYYPSISAWLWVAFGKIDRFMSFLTLRPVGSTYELGSDGTILVGLSVVWLALIGISYALRALEYLVFDLQV